jgi:hypothetical protein
MPSSWGKGPENPKGHDNDYFDRQYVKYFDALGYDFVMKREAGKWVVTVIEPDYVGLQNMELVKTEPRDSLSDALLESYTKSKSLLWTAFRHRD